MNTCKYCNSDKHLTFLSDSSFRLTLCTNCCTILKEYKEETVWIFPDNTIFTETKNLVQNITTLLNMHSAAIVADIDTKSSLSDIPILVLEDYCNNTSQVLGSVIPAN